MNKTFYPINAIFKSRIVVWKDCGSTICLSASFQTTIGFQSVSRILLHSAIGYGDLCKRNGL
jgi:hypothetical protein